MEENQEEKLKQTLKYFKSNVLDIKKSTFKAGLKYTEAYSQLDNKFINHYLNNEITDVEREKVHLLNSLYLSEIKDIILSAYDLAIKTASSSNNEIMSIINKSNNSSVYEYYDFLINPANKDLILKNLLTACYCSSEVTAITFNFNCIETSTIFNELGEEINGGDFQKFNEERYFMIQGDRQKINSLKTHYGITKYNYETHQHE